MELEVLRSRDILDETRQALAARKGELGSVAGHINQTATMLVLR